MLDRRGVSATGPWGGSIDPSTLSPRPGSSWRVIINIAVLASGSGTNLQALIDMADPAAVISLVISDKPDARALERARKAGIPTLTVDGSRFPDRDAFSAELGGALDGQQVDALVLAGFMRILGHGLVYRFRHRILNVHPSLLPSFPGASAVEQALRYGVKVTGVTVHFVDEEVDHGPIIAQRAIPVLDDDDRDTLHARIQIVEHDLYPEVVAAFARGKVRVEERSVVWV